MKKLNLSWKTTVAGVLTILPTVAHLLFPTVVTTETATALTALFASLGLVAAKDSNVSGGTKPATEEAADRIAPKV